MSEDLPKTSLADALLETTQAELRRRAETQIPKAWRASERRNDDGSVDVTSGAYESSYEASEASLLRDHGYDPETHMIQGGWKQSSWTAYRPKEYRRNTEDGDPEDLEAYTFTAKAFKFKVVSRPAGSRASDVEDLVRALDGRTPQPRAEALAGKGTFIYMVGDLQLGKLESPLEEVAEVFLRNVDKAVSRIEGAEHIHIAWMGDCIEGSNSQGGALRWRTTLTITEQVRVLQRLMLYAVEAFAPHCDQLTMVSVPGNHDEAAGRDLQTRADDSWAIQAAVNVEDAINFSQRKDLQHVRVFVPGPDQQGVVLDCGGLRVAHIHGHVHRLGKHFEWLAGQSLGRQPEGDADLLLEGHWHHLQWLEQAPRTYICAPAMESESVWWKHKTGTPGAPGSLLIRIEDAQVTTVERLR